MSGFFIFFSETTRPIGTKFGRNVHCMVHYIILILYLFHEDYIHPDYIIMNYKKFFFYVDWKYPKETCGPNLRVFVSGAFIFQPISIVFFFFMLLIQLFLYFFFFMLLIQFFFFFFSLCSLYNSFYLFFLYAPYTIRFLFQQIFHDY